MDKTAIVTVIGSGLALALACSSASTGSGVQGNYGGANGSGPAGQGGGSGSGPGGSGVGALGGIAGGINPDSGMVRDANPDGACQGIDEPVLIESLPVDIVWGVDTSLSMFDEAVAVQENINAFSQQITSAMIDVHVVMLAGYPFIPGFPSVCVGAPLGTGQCPGDSKPPSFFHHPQAVVNSNDGASVFINRFPDYRQYLRPNALKYWVIVTDDDSVGNEAGAYANNPDKFIADLTAVDPMLRAPNGGPGWKMSGMYAHTQCLNAFNVGNFWKAVIDKTGGVHGDICACTQAATCTQAFKGVLDSLAKTITTAAKPLECEYSIPNPPAGQTFDKEKVNFDLTSNGARENIGWVNDAGACHPELGGWYYDNNDAPTRILTCPKSCEKIKATTNGGVSVQFGCARRPIPIAR